MCLPAVAASFRVVALEAPPEMAAWAAATAARAEATAALRAPPGEAVAPERLREAAAALEEAVEMRGPAQLAARLELAQVVPGALAGRCSI